jgi:hypothetical protein
MLCTFSRGVWYWGNWILTTKGWTIIFADTVSSRCTSSLCDSIIIRYGSFVMGHGEGEKVEWELDLGRFQGWIWN